MAVERQPYVVSADVQPLMERWGKQTGYQVPSADYFEGMNNDLASALDQYFPGQVEIVGYDELKSGLDRLAAQTFLKNPHRFRVDALRPLPIISWDRVYVDKETPNVAGHLDITRGVSEKLNNLGLLPRPGFPSVSDQLDRFKSDTDQPYIMMDDVIFTASGMHDIIEELINRGSSIVGIIAGIGITSIGLEELRKLIDVQCVREYSEVIDEVCQRDFVAGVPMSGRTVFHADGEVSSAPYFLPFGKPREWASIPEANEREFSGFCIDTSIDLFKRIETISQSTVPTSAIDRLPRFTRHNNSFASALEEVKKEVFSSV